ncbi:DUF6931 family protein [Endozoicomonas sp.]|uniref:DUF6931 family protein n=1 Tax=Endozoicomonas sp. TaxID=1892382 RepID=UPI00383B2329
MSALLFDDLPRILELYDFDEHIVELAQEVKVNEPGYLLSSLLKDDHFGSAVSFLSHCLKKDFAIAWGYACLIHVPVSWSQQEMDVLGNIKSWLREPTDKHRRFHEKNLHSLGVKSPVAWLGQALFWSGGSITPEDAPDVSPSPGLLGQAISGAVQLAGLVEDGSHSSKLYPRFINLGIRVVEGMQKDELLSLKLVGV